MQLKCHQGLVSRERLTLTGVPPYDIAWNGKQYRVLHLQPTDEYLQGYDQPSILINTRIDIPSI